MEPTFCSQPTKAFRGGSRLPHYLADEQTESVFELSLSGLTTWEGRPSLTQGRIYGVFENKQAEFEKCYEQIVRIRRHWRKNPATWMGGYVGPAAARLV